MTETMAHSEYRECGSDAAAHALGALEPAEADAFRRHLASCAVCQDEVAVFEQAVDLLPMSAPQYPPPRGLRRRVMRTVRAQPHAPVPSSARARVRTGWPRTALAGGIAAMAVAVAIVAVTLSGGSGAGSPRIVQASVVGLPGSAQLRLSGGRAELVVSHLAPPPPGHVYEVWLKRPRQPPAPTSALFSVTSEGSGDVAVPGSLHGVSAVLVTPEPDGGSPRPTHAPVIVAHL